MEETPILDNNPLDLSAPLIEGEEKDYSHPRYDRFRDMPFSKIYDKDGNDVTRERTLPKVLLNCEDCGIDIKVIEEDYEAGVAIIKCKPCKKEQASCPS